MARQGRDHLDTPTQAARVPWQQAGTCHTPGARPCTQTGRLGGPETKRQGGKGAVQRPLLALAYRLGGPGNYRRPATPKTLGTVLGGFCARRSVPSVLVSETRFLSGERHAGSVREVSTSVCTPKVPKYSRVLNENGSNYKEAEVERHANQGEIYPRMASPAECRGRPADRHRQPRTARSPAGYGASRERRRLPQPRMEHEFTKNRRPTWIYAKFPDTRRLTTGNPAKTLKTRPT